MTEPAPEVEQPATAETLAKYLGVAGRADVAPLVADAWNMATQLVDDLAANAFRAVPPAVLDHCRVEVGANLYRRRDEQAGSQQVVMEGSNPVRAPRDPLGSIRAVLGRYVTWL